MANNVINRLQNVYLDSVYAFVNGDGEYFQFELYIRIGDYYFNLKTLEKLDAEIKQMVLVEGVGERGYVFKNGSSLGLMTSIVRPEFDRIDFDPYWMPHLEFETHPVLRFDRLSDRTAVVSIGSLLDYEKEFNEKLKLDYARKKQHKSSLSEASSRRLRQDIDHFYYAVSNAKQQGEE